MLNAQQGHISLFTFGSERIKVEYQCLKLNRGSHLSLTATVKRISTIEEAQWGLPLSNDYVGEEMQVFSLL